MKYFGVDKDLNFGRQQILDLSSENNPKVILDIGAGLGKDLDKLKVKFPKARTLGVECNGQSVFELRKNGHEVIEIDIERDVLPLPDSSVDLIVANQIMEHCKEIFWIFHEASRVLKPDGIFIIGVPNLGSLHNRFLLLLGHQPTSIQLWSAHVRGFTAHGFRSFLQNIFNNGYKIENFKGSNFYPFPAFLARPLAWMFPRLAVGIFFRIRKIKPYNHEFLTYPKEKKLETNFYLGDE
jgi:SAM-dependent methyltransferase